MILINTSDTIASLLPEVYHSLDPDTPYSDELSIVVKRYLKHLILQAFFHVITEEYYFEKEWLNLVRKDKFLNQLSDRRWVDLDVVDTDGTYVLIIEEIS